MTPRQESKLNEIHELLAGTLERKGLVHELKEMKTDVKDLKNYKEVDKKLKAKVAGGIMVGTPVLTLFWHWLQQKLFS